MLEFSKVIMFLCNYPDVNRVGVDLGIFIEVFKHL